MSAVPEVMRGLVLARHDDDVAAAVGGLTVETLPVPRPRPGEVLVRVAAAPCNPSDLLFIRGVTGLDKPLPTVPGWEGSGTVVAGGGGLLARWLQGKRVAFASQAPSGTWAEYHAVPARQCVPLASGLELEAAATLLINPLTALAFADLVRAGGHRAALSTAAAGQLGRMFVRLARQREFTVVNVVRRPEQAALLRAEGAGPVLDASAPEFDARLQDACLEHGVGIAFDAVAGEMTGRVLRALPPGSSVVVYGALADARRCVVDPIDVLFREKHVTGFFLGHWLQRQGVLRALRTARRAQRLVRDGALGSTIARRAALDEGRAALLDYVARPTEGKVLIVP